MIPVQTLIELDRVTAHFEEIIRHVSLDAMPTLSGMLSQLQMALQVRLHGGQAETSPSTSSEACNYLSVQEVSERFHVTPRWLYRHKRQLPHSQPTRKTLIFPEKGIERYFAARTNRG